MLHPRQGRQDYGSHLDRARTAGGRMILRSKIQDSWSDLETGRPLAPYRGRLDPMAAALRSTATRINQNLAHHPDFPLCRCFLYNALSDKNMKSLPVILLC